MIVAHYDTSVDLAFPSLFNSTSTLRKYSFLVSTYSRGAIEGVYLSSDSEWKVFVQKSENRRFNNKVMKKTPLEKWSSKHIQNNISEDKFRSQNKC